jgi:hypothetical protein
MGEKVSVLKTKLLTCFAFSFILILVILMSNLNIGQCATLDEAEKKAAFEFLERVLDINVDNYHIVTPDFWVQEMLHPGHVETWLSMDLSNGNQKLKIEIDFIDGRFHRYYVENSSQEEPLTNNPSFVDFVNTAKEVLNRYQLHFNATYCSLFTPLLEQVTQLDRNETVETDKTVLKFHAQDETGHVSFLWYCKVNDIVAKRKCFYMEFDNRGFLVSIIDWWGIYQIGNADVNISKETAINMALELAQNLTEEIGAKIKSIEATLQFDGSSERGDCYTLYPEWDIVIHYDKTYYGIYGYAVNIWADTGEVSYEAGRFFFDSPEANQPVNPLIIIILVTFLSASFLLAFFKKRKE